MQFKEVVGHQEIKEKLIFTIKENRVSHAQLFLGPEGSGNLALAIAYAQYISCENKLENDSCGVCPSCLKFKKLVHPDLHFVFPVATSKTIKKDPVSDDYIAQWRESILENPYFNQNKWYETIDVENKQGIISKNESYEILKKLNLKTFESEYKIMIIWLPEKMNAFAANKLLKLIEEPPAKTLFLLVSENSEQMLPTILSRTQLFKIPKVDKVSMHTNLCDNFGLSPEEAEDITHLANGNYFEAQNLINSVDEENFNFEQFTSLMRFSYQRKVLELIEWVDEISRVGREKQKNFLIYAIRLVRENFMLNLNEKKIVYLTQKEFGFSEKFSQFINNENVVQIYEVLNKAHADISMNAYNKIVFLDLALKIIKLIKK
ncbi:MAG: DNA polymerase III subunit delta [Bacteroidales bacterium]|jgi:DNA polymerase-3 subunit delta'|nr:DNA polymerase III subunit delta [Bacteroidales bacterium]